MSQPIRGRPDIMVSRSAENTHLVEDFASCQVLADSIKGVRGTR